MPDWKQCVREHLPPLGLRAEREAEIVEELAQHLEQSYAEALADGATEPEAMARAVAGLDDSEAVGWALRRTERPLAGQVADGWRRVQGAEIPRRERRAWWLTDWWQDVRFGARLLVKDRWFTLAAATALALGIGANAAVFSFVNMLLRGLPFHEPDRIMALWTEDASGRQLRVSELDFKDWRVDSRAFSDLAAFRNGSITVSDEGRVPERIQSAYVTRNFFRLIGQPQVIGRAFTDADDQPAPSRSSYWATASGRAATTAIRPCWAAPSRPTASCSAREPAILRCSPNATIYEVGGATPSPQPFPLRGEGARSAGEGPVTFIVMEHVEGKPLSPHEPARISHGPATSSEQCANS